MFDSEGVLIAKKHDDILAAHRKIIEVIEDNDWNAISPYATFPMERLAAGIDGAKRFYHSVHRPTILQE